MSSTRSTHSPSDFEKRQQAGFTMLIAMATSLVVFAIVVATSLPVSEGLKLSPMDADEVAAQMASTGE